MHTFNINFLDHVAIRAKDVELSAQWYEKVLGLKRMNMPQWKNYPVFMAFGKSGVAIFPAKTDDPELNKFSKNSKIDHFAFNVSNEDLGKAKEHFQQIGLEFKSQDHFYFHSIYISDLDGHTVELTAQVTGKGLLHG